LANEAQQHSVTQCLLEPITGAQLIKKFTVSYEIRMFITVLTRARYWSLSSDWSNLSTHFTSYYYLHFHFITVR